MLAIVVLFVTAGMVSWYLGARFLRSVLRPALAPELPAARVANTVGAERAYQQTTDAASRGARTLGKAFAIAAAVFMLLWPLALAIWFFTTSSPMGAGSL